MTWLDSLDASIADALTRFPVEVNTASFTVGGETYLIGLDSLQNMMRMQLGHLPVEAIALPYDISRLLTQPHEENLVKDVTHHLSDFFPNFFVAAVYEMQSLFAAQGLQAYIIGGITRDMLVSTERRYDIQDVDITIEGKALDAARYVSEMSKNFDLQQEFVSFGTAKLNYKGQIEIDFASTRREEYLGCGLLPQIVEVGVPLEDDIIRRDFTVNALALSVLHPGKVIDCTGGLQDLEDRLIRLLKAESFFEDPSRIIRAFKFPIRLDFDWSIDTNYLMDRFLLWMPEVYKGGGERIREELYMMLSQPESDAKTRWLSRFLEKGLHRLLNSQMPPVVDLPVPLTQLVQRLQIIQVRLSEYWTPEMTWEIYLAFIFLGLPPVSVEQVADRSGLNRHEIEVIEKSFRLLNENVVYAVTPFDSVTKVFDIFHSLPLASACVGVILSPQFETSLDALVKYKHELENVKLEVTGDDILSLGVPQGEQVGKLLKALHYAKLQGQVQHRVDELNWLKLQISGQGEE